MVKWLKAGRVVIVLQGKLAGKKAVIVQNAEGGNKERPYGHCVLAGIRHGPRKVTRDMPKKHIKRRIKIIPFVKVVNHTHVMPTRYNMDLGTGFKGQISVKDANKRRLSRRLVGKLFREKLIAGKNKWFLPKTPLLT
eukprot:NODE_10253_length_528_cov_256.639506_g9606_i0.p1 GENE.NODE_10253_length_528_cov_256.639506_g9606_i0~~NODE_10253_length_528_cov_256.639506_g9606_i0.p1  ORF type:complete len:137 (+),score=18.50 NODE_10253_length_528_cov_256.639506_g9606_i0:62-472(+)